MGFAVHVLGGHRQRVQPLRFQPAAGGEQHPLRAAAGDDGFPLLIAQPRAQRRAVRRPLAENCLPVAVISQPSPRWRSVTG